MSNLISLDLGLVYSTSATYSYSTTVTRSFSSSEKRIANWVQPKASYQIGNRGLTYSELNSLVDFHRAVQGSLTPFSFKDYSDYQASNSIGVTTTSTQVFTLYKEYSFGGITQRRYNLVVDPSTLVVLANNTPIPYTLIDNEITVTTNVGSTISATFEYSIPVRFKEDTIDFTLNAVDPSSKDRIYELGNVSLTEVRTSKGFSTPFPSSTTEVFDIGYDLGSITIPFYSTRILPTQSGHEKRVADWPNPLLKYSIGSRKYTSKELKYLLNLFHACRGKSVSFQFRDRSRDKIYSLRFDVDSIASQFNAYDIATKESIYTVSGINLYGSELT